MRAEILHTDDIASWSVSSSSSPSSSSRQPTKRRRLDASSAPESENADAVDEPHGANAAEFNDAQIKDLNLLVPNLSLSTGCAPGFIPGAPPSAVAQSLSHQLLALLHSARLVRAEDLRIWHEGPDLESGEPTRHDESEAMDVDEEKASAFPSSKTKREVRAFWVLYIDVMIISLAGNPFDAAWAAVVAALKNTTLPRAWWDRDSEMVICSDEVSEASKLSLRGFPVACSFCVFEADAAAGWRAVVIPDGEQMEREQRELQNGQTGGRSKEQWILADPDGYEESLCHERICIVVDRKDEKTVILKMEKNGGWTVGKSALKHLVDLSAQRWEEMRKILEL